MPFSWVTRFKQIMMGHAPHLISGGSKWFAECMGCDWATDGEGGMMDALDAHTNHVAEELSKAVFGGQVRHTS